MVFHEAAITPTRFVDINSHRLAYRDIGNGLPVILCSPFGATLDVWDPAFLQGLAGHFRIITFEYAATGRSTGLAGRTARALGAEIISLADSLCIDIFAVIGWSLGGVAAQSVMQRFPHRISRLVMIAAPPAIFIRSQASRRAIARMLSASGGFEMLKAYLFDAGSRISQHAQAASEARLTERQFDRSPPAATMQPRSGLPETLSASAFLSGLGMGLAGEAVSIPALAISGTRDRLFPHRDWSRVIELWPCLQLLLIPQAGHAPHHQSHRLCTELIVNFINTGD